MQFLLTFKNRRFDVFSGRSLKSWGVQCEVQTFCSSGRRWGFVSSPDGEFASQPLLATLKYFPSYSHDMQELLSCFINFMFFQGCPSICSMDSVCLWKEVSSGSFYTVILNQNFHSYVKQVKL